MNLLYKKGIKQQILDNIGQADILYKKIQSVLSHSANIYWCRQLRYSDSFETQIHRINMQNELPLMISYLKEFKGIYLITNKLCLDYPKLQEFSENYFRKQLVDILENINQQIENFTTLNYYHKDEELKSVVKLLEIAKKSTESNLQFVTDYQAEEMMSL